jgi:agmatine deiminase
MTSSAEPAPSAPLCRMPAEWEPHRATWLTWPEKAESWPGIFERIPGAFASIVRALRRFEEVRLLVRDAAAAASVRGRPDLAEAGSDLHALGLVEIPTNDAWIRDYGPIFARRADGSLAATLWRFNAWGGKYPPWDLDQAAAARMAAAAGIRGMEADMVLEGGSIDVNGAGALLTTEACLLNPNRNPELGRKDIEARLRQYLGATKVLWLGDGIVGDDTDGHVDDLARFVGPATVVAAVEEDPEDPNYRLLQENLERLEAMSDQDGRRLEVVELPMPEPVFHQGTRSPASYANFYLANGGVLVPTFRSRRDARALGILKELFPDRQVVGIDCTDLVWGLGAIHCLTQQEPIAGGAQSASCS